MRRSRSAFSVAAACSAFAIGTIGGCDSSGPRTTTVHLMVGIDTSVSARERQLLGPAVLLTAGLARRLQPGQDWLTLYRVDSETHEFSDREVPARAIAFQQTIIETVRSAPAHQGTLPARFWTTVAERAKHTRRPTAVAFFTDGDNDDPAANSRGTIRAAARKLADNPRIVAVAIYGAVPKNRAYLRHSFRPLGHRFLVYGPTEMDLEPLVDRLNQARR